MSVSYGLALGLPFLVLRELGTWVDGGLAGVELDFDPRMGTHGEEGLGLCGGQPDCGCAESTVNCPRAHSPGHGATVGRQHRAQYR